MLSSFEPQAVLIQIGILQVHWYGLLIALSALIAYFLTQKLAQKISINKSDVIDLFFYLIIFGIIGARLVHILGNPSFYLNNPLQVFAVWYGGLAIHGALLVGFVTLIIFIKKRKLNFWKIVDVLAPGLILGQAIGRWGNFFNQELFGGPTNLFWKIFISPQNRPTEFISNSYFHPVFLYESLLNLALFIILFLLLKSQKLKAGSIFLFYILGYSLIRFFIEFFRINPTVEIFDIRLAQITSVVLIIIALAFLIKRKLKN